MNGWKRERIGESRFKKRKPEPTPPPIGAVKGSLWGTDRWVGTVADFDDLGNVIIIWNTRGYFERLRELSEDQEVPRPPRKAESKGRVWPPLDPDGNEASEIK